MLSSQQTLNRYSLVSYLYYNDKKGFFFRFLIDMLMLSTCGADGEHQWCGW